MFRIHKILLSHYYFIVAKSVAILCLKFFYFCGHNPDFLLLFLFIILTVFLKNIRGIKVGFWPQNRKKEPKKAQKGYLLLNNNSFLAEKRVPTLPRNHKISSE